MFTFCNIHLLGYSPSGYSPSGYPPSGIFTFRDIHLPGHAPSGTCAFLDTQALACSPSGVLTLGHRRLGYSLSGIFASGIFKLQAFPIGHSGQHSVTSRQNGHATLNPIPTRSPHIVVIKNDPGVPGRPLWPTVGDTTAKRPYHPQPPFQHAAHTLLSSKTTQAFPTGHSGRQPVTSPANRPYRLNLHSDTQPTPSCHQKRLRRARSATLADSR